MATTIFHEGAELKNAAAGMRTVIRSMTNIENTIAQIHSRTSPVWEGQASDQNTRNFQKLRQINTTYLTDAEKTKAALDEAVAAYEKTETEQVNRVFQLDTKGIF